MRVILRVVNEGIHLWWVESLVIGSLSLSLSLSLYPLPCFLHLLRRRIAPHPAWSVCRSTGYNGALIRTVSAAPKKDRPSWASDIALKAEVIRAKRCPQSERSPRTSWERNRNVVRMKYEEGAWLFQEVLISIANRSPCCISFPSFA